MPRANAKQTSSRVAKKSPNFGGASDELSAAQVIETLLGLFEDLGVSVSQQLSGTNNGRKPVTTAQTLYPYTSEIGEMLTYWHQHSQYLDEKGDPVRIKLSGKRPSFRHLAKLKAPKIDVPYLLSELERLGAVSIDDNKFITVRMRSFPMYEDKRLAVQHTLNVLDGFIKTLRHNLHSSPSNSDQLFHRVASNQDFNTQEIPALKVRVKRYGQSFLESFDDWLMRKSLSRTRKTKRGAKRAKVSIGIYLSIDKNNGR
jgi:hypothetical protein